MNIIEFQDVVVKFSIAQGDDLSNLDLARAAIAGLVVDVGQIHVVLDGSIPPGGEGEVMNEVARSFALMVMRAALATEVLERNDVVPRPDATLWQIPNGSTCGHYDCGALELLTRITTLRVLASNDARPEAHAHLIALTGALLNHVEPMLGLEPEEFLAGATKSMKETN